ncbi:MAG: metallophosphatase [Bacteroidetes bacterium]|nr:metallophosphatase [Bacteroidota bacterium]
MDDYNFKNNRRDFIKFLLGSGVALSNLSFIETDKLIAKKGFKKITLLYTNDQHSRIEPFPENDAKYPSEGGFSKRAGLIEKIRSEEKNVLLLDAGDIFQGTPYFNYYHGELEYKLMSLMQYDATTFGNHDFDMGCENILKQLPHANFSFINCNYDFKDTPLMQHKKIMPHKIFCVDGVKIGITGVGIDLNNLVDSRFVGNVKYQSPIEKANAEAAILKHDKKCDFVICLSHIGYNYRENKISDIDLAKESRDIELIIGGHTHTFLESPDIQKNKLNNPVQITQMGWAGIWLGRIDIYFTPNNKIIVQNNTPSKIN